MDEYRRPSTWAASLGVGLLAAAMAVLHDLPGLRDWPYYIAPAVQWFAGVLVFVNGLPVLFWLICLFLDTARQWQDTFKKPPQVVELSETVAEKEPEEYDAEQQAWRVALDRFFRAGDAAGGFSAGKLAGVAGSDAWPRLVHFYASESGGNVLRDAGGNTGHTWGHGWSLDRVMLALGNDKLPHPDMPVPNIEPYVAAATQRRASQKSKTPAPRVIDAPPRLTE